QGWRPMTLGDVTIWSSGGTPKKDVSEYWDGDIPWISANSMYGTRFGASNLKITEAGLKNGSRLAEKDSVLLLVRGGALHNRIPVGIATRDVAFNQDVKALKARADLISPWYLLFWLMAHEKFLLESVVEYTGIGAGKLDTKRMQALPFLLPPAEEVSAIEGLAKAIDDRIVLLRETNATLEAMAQALFKSWFVDFDPVHANANASTKQMINPASSPSDFVGDPAAPLDSRLRGNDDLLPPELQTHFPASFTASQQGLVPEGWKWLELDEAYELNPKRNLKKGALAKYLDMASVGTSGHTAESAINREFGSGTKFINGDTLLARITPCLENGKTAFVDFLEEDEIGWGSTEFIVMRPKAPLPAYHAYLLARFPVFREFAIQSMSGTSGRQRVQNDVLGRYMLAVPGSAVAELFGQTVEAMQQKIAANHQQAQTLATLRDTLLPRLISGQLRLPEADAMQAEVCDV
ncbi:MAG: restriction endonuclease subunit S, partial [Burkholderiales bacterium]|nr:restriction endonuclease subunit S [Burkholderiales bacterium]